MNFSTQDFFQEGAILSLNKDTVILGYGSSQWHTKQELNSKKTSFYFPDFFLEVEKPWLQFFYEIEFSIIELFSLLNTQIQKPLSWIHPKKESFLNEIDAFRKTELKKAVLYTTFDAKNNSFSPCNSLKSALQYLQNHPSSYLYGFWKNGSGILGVTPELLFDQVNATQYKTFALAGTLPKQEKINKKIHKEHDYVIRGISDSLHSLGSIQIGKQEMVQLPFMKHMKTPIDIFFDKPLDFESIVKALHPTPALGTYPKNMHWLKEYNHKINRNRYGAPVGLLQPNSLSRCSVAIRNVQWDPMSLNVAVGCGIIKESVPEEEWKEINLKMKSIKGILSL